MIKREPIKPVSQIKEKPVSQIKDKFDDPRILRRSRDPLLEQKRSKYSLQPSMLKSDSINTFDNRSNSKISAKRELFENPNFRMPYNHIKY